VPKILEQLFTARILSIALVVEVGFIVGVYAGRAETMSPLQWGGAGLALAASAVFAAIIHAWPETQAGKAQPARVRHER